MPESAVSFRSLPPEYQQVIQLAQGQHNISITPLQELVGGWSGAVIYLVSVVSSDTGRVEHLVLKLDRKRPMSNSDEVTRHQAAREKSPAGFAQQHIPEMVYEPAEAGDALARPPKKRGAPLPFKSTHLDGNVPAVLEDIFVPKYQIFRG